MDKIGGEGVMIIRKRRIARALLAIATLSGLLLGCGSDSEGTEETLETETDGYSGTLVISIHDQLNNEGIVEALEVLQSSEKWENVEFDIRPQDVDYETNIPIYVMGGQQIDVMCNFNPIQQATNYEAGIILPLEEYLDELDVDVDERYGSWSSFAYTEGEIYGVPDGASTWALFYNISIFDNAGIEYPDSEIPMTWDEYRQLAADLTSGSGADKIYGTLSLDWPMYWYGEAIMKLGGGEAFYTEDGLSNIEDPAFAEALEAAYIMQNIDQSTPTVAEISSSKIEPDGWFNGNYAMYLHGTWFLNWLADTETYPRDYEVGIAPMPIPEGTTESLTWGVCATYSIPTTSADPLMATEFIVDLVMETTANSSSTIMSDQTVEQENLFVTVADEIPDTQFTTDKLKDIFLGQTLVTEKVTGTNASEYEEIIIEEANLYLAGTQDLETTITNIKERGDAEILK